MSDKNTRLTFADLRRGRNPVDSPAGLAETECAEAINVDFYNSPCGGRRKGVSVVSTASSPFGGKIISSLFRHVPGTDETLAELWGVDDNGTPRVGRLAGGTTWATPTLKDAPTGNGWDFTFASLNSLLFIAYLSAVDRMHVWDPVLNKVRRTGMAAMSVPTVADAGGAGTYAATLRYYRTRATEQRTGVTVRRSEPSPSVSFTPSGANLNATVTLAGAPGEDETHWEIEGSTDNVTFYRLSTVVIGTTTYADTAAVATYSTNPVSAVTGTYTLQRSYKFVAADQGRLLGFGMWTSTNPQSRIEYSAVIGSLDVGDAERVPTGNYKGLDENDSGAATGIVGPVDGSFFAFKYRQFWKGTPTGDVTTPYNWIALDKTIGAVGPKAIAVGEDEQGHPTLYFMSFRGPFRYGTMGKQYIGKQVEDFTVGNAMDSLTGKSLKLASTTVTSHVLWYPAKRQVWCWVATTASGNDPFYVLVYTVGASPSAFYSLGGIAPAVSGWSYFDNLIGRSRCSTLFSATLGASMSRDLQPYVGSVTTSDRLGLCDSGTQDFSTAYAASITTRAERPWGIGFTGTIAGGNLLASAPTSISLTVSPLPEFGRTGGAMSATVVLDAVSPGFLQSYRLGSFSALAEYVQFTVADLGGGSAADAWRLFAIDVTWTRGSPIAA